MCVHEHYLRSAVCVRLCVFSPNEHRRTAERDYGWQR